MFDITLFVFLLSNKPKKIMQNLLKDKKNVTGGHTLTSIIKPREENDEQTITHQSQYK